MNLSTITDRLIKDLTTIPFAPPVTHVYNPLVYARHPYERYLKRFAKKGVRTILVGMNPGPWGMAQTGIPFGEIDAVRHWMGIEGTVDLPANRHPKRPIEGFACRRSEVSGRRLWGWAKATYETPQAFFARFFVVNYCPLLFFDAEGRNRTPDKLSASERNSLTAVCDQALHDTLSFLQPRFAVGIGAYAARRVATAAGGLDIATGRVTHPSPANPRANRGWGALVMQELRQTGIPL